MTVYVPKGKEILLRRKKRGLTQKELAAAASVSKKTIERLERSEHATAKTLMRVHGVLGGSDEWSELVESEVVIRSRQDHRKGEPIPFTPGGPVVREEAFFGRWDQRDQLMECLEKRYQVQVLGEIGFGKTSLLRFVERRSPPEGKTVYINAKRIRSPMDLVAAIARDLGKADVVRTIGEELGSDQSAAAERILSELTPITLLLDDAEPITRKGHGFNEGFFETCRGLGEEGRLLWVSASRQNLYDLFRVSGLTSAFLNASKKVWVGQLEEEAVVALTRPLHATGLEGYARELAAGFPFGLQWLGDYILRRPDVDRLELEDMLSEEVRHHFESWWKGLEPTAQQVLKQRQGRVIAKLDGPERRTLRHVLLPRGLAIAVKGRAVVPGTLWRDYVDRAPPPGAG